MLVKDIIKEMADTEKPLVNTHLADLSQLSGANVKEFAQVWKTIELKRRREIINRLTELSTDSVELNFDNVFINCLTDPDEAPPFKLTVKRPFWLGKVEVTNEQFRLFRPDHNSRSVPVDTPLHSTSTTTSSAVGGVNARRLSSICSGCFSTTAMVSIAHSFDRAELKLRNCNAKLTYQTVKLD